MNYFSQFNHIKKTLSCILILIFAITTVYFNSLKGSFQFDDANFQERIWVSNLKEYQERVQWFTFNIYSPGTRATIKPIFKIIAARPAVLFTFALNNDLNKNSPFGFHLANLTFHILTTILVFSVVRLALKISRLETKKGTSFALISALLFAIHPALSESVSYISARSSELLTFFYLLGVWRFLLLFQEKDAKKTNTSINILLIFLCFYLSLTSKIVAATFPVALILIFILIICPKNYPNLYRKLTSARFLIAYIFLLILILIFATEIPLLDKGKTFYGHLGYLFIQIKIIVFYYLKIFLWPINLNVDISYPFTTLQNDPRIILATLIGLGLITLAGLKGGKWAKFCAGWFILALAPTSSILPVNDLAVEHRLYLPASLGLCPLFALTIQHISKKLRYNFLFILLASFAILTADRNKVWTTEFNLWQDALKKSPNSPRPYNNIGKAHYNKGNVDLALEYFKKSARLYDELETVHYNIANIYMDKKQFELSEKEYKRAIEINDLYYDAYMGLGSLKSQTGKLKEAEQNYLKAISIRSFLVAKDEKYPLARLNLGEVYGKMGRYEDSIKQSKIALKSLPNSFRAFYNIGTANMQLKRLEEAKVAFLNCLNIAPNFENALYNLAFVYQQLGQFENSNQYFLKFLNVQKSFPKAYVSIGINYAQMNKLDKAINYFKKALELDPKNVDAQSFLEKALLQKSKNN